MIPESFEPPRAPPEPDLLDGRETSSEELGVGPTSLGLHPAQPIEWWVGGHAEATFERAARLGGAWYAGPGISAADSVGSVNEDRRMPRSDAASGVTTTS